TYVNGQVTFALSPLIRGIPLARKILLADDSVTAQNMGRKILADAGYEVIAVNNGSAALKKIGELKPDLVILDVYMPGYSGLEVCQRLKESPETARIPVLLTVGKLEPFKPEEAQRVRAEGFIVKPFEASELLGTLSKLEDKVVPRSESSKPGRFARAMAAADESGRGGRDEATDADNGWKSRIGFPKKKTEEQEEKVAGEASNYSPVEKVSNKNKNEETRQGAEKAVEASLDVAALAPAGLPKDVTPEEVAAIAAAAAQMQMVASAIRQEQQPSATSNTDAQSTATVTKPPEPTPDRTESNLPSAAEVSRDAVPAVVTEAKPAALAESKKEESKLDSRPTEPAPVETYRRRKGDVSPDVSVPDVRVEDGQDVPVTMAATAESVVAASVGGPRWTAVSVALEGSESAISLDQEMQKAYAAVAAAGSASVAAIAQAEPAPAAKSFASAPAMAETPATIPNAAPVPGPESEPARNVASVEAEPVPIAHSESAPVAAPFEAAAPTPVAAVHTPVEAPAEASTTVTFSDSKQEPARFPEPVTSRAQELQPKAEPATAEAATVTISEIVAEKPVAATVPEPKFDSETVKNTAAAWATWRQVHDSGQGNEVAETQAKEKAEEKEVNQPESAPPDTAARAVAAGAEQLLQEAAAATQEGEQSNVASIVDSVLADLRPKLMEEINRKMSKKK
ncbi:MAG: response regulator, partial [Candidatus Sulfotelmatobacter sp.]